MRIGTNGWLGLAGTLVAALLAWAWFDGGLRPLRPMAEAVVLPGAVR